MPQHKPTTLKLANFPLQLRQAPRWLLWRGDKIPYYTNGRRRGSYGGGLDCPADLEHLVDAKTAYAKLKASNGTYNGLGFALGGGWYGFDFDHVRDPVTAELPGVIAQQLNAGIGNGMYAEVSPSGTGLHLIGFWSGELRFRNGRQGDHLEAYHSGRYFTMTGNVCAGAVRLREYDPEPALPARTALRLAATNGRQTAQNDAGAAQPGKVGSGWLADRQTILECLKDLNADCPREPWRDAGMVIHHTSKGSAEGLAIWERWSATAAGALNTKGDGPRYVPGHCAEQWRSFGKSDAPPLKLGTLLDMAKKARAQQRAPDDAPAVRQARVLPGNLPDYFSGDELDAMDIPATRWLVADLIAPGLTLLAAPPKSGKSYLALQMAECVAAGRPFLDRETTASRVSYFDLEQWHGLIRPRRQAIGKAHALPKGTPIYFKLTMGAGDGALADMQTEIERGSKLLIVDLFVRVRDELSEDAKKNAYARDYAAVVKMADFALQHPEVAIVVVHHANKGKHDEWQAKISGSYGLTGGSHANVYMERPDARGMERDDKEHALRYRVLRAQGKLVQEQEIVIEMMPAMGGWQCSKMKAWEISATLLQTKVLLMLAAKYPAFTSAKDIADIVGRPYVGVRQMLIRMAALGKIESEGQGGAGYRVRRIST